MSDHSDPDPLSNTHGHVPEHEHHHSHPAASSSSVPSQPARRSSYTPHTHSKLSQSSLMPSDENPSALHLGPAAQNADEAVHSHSGSHSRSDGSQDAGEYPDDVWTEQLRKSLSSLPNGRKQREEINGSGDTGGGGGLNGIRRASETTAANDHTRPSSELGFTAAHHPRSLSGSGSDSAPSGAGYKSMPERSLLTPSSSTKPRPSPLGHKERLKRSEAGVVKRRDGAVLARGSILKTDHYPSGTALDLDFHLKGAPNWRAPKEESLNVFGVAQPTLPGLRGILSVLGCRPRPERKISQATGPGQNGQVDHEAGDKTSEDNERPGRCVWFCTREEPVVYISGRPFVLRDASAPKRTMALSDRAENLEQIERRLKDDILQEAKRHGGLILTHDELENGDLMPTWTSVDEGTVHTVREAYEKIRDQGWSVEYHRIPISSDRPIEDNYLDAYVDVLKDVDPFTTSLVFNDGMGAVRATFAMCAALLMRRKQCLLRNMDEPFSHAGLGVATPASGWQAAHFLQQAQHQQAQNKSLLHLTRALNQILDRSPHVHRDPTALLASNATLLDGLRKAHMGNYQVILSLLSSIEQGKETKAIVDTIIDSCDDVVNLREMIVELRMQYSVSTADESTRINWLDRALQALERYFFLIAFARYVEEEQAGSTGKRFADWLLARPEIWNQIQVMRRRGGGRLFIFAPVNDLTPLTRAVMPAAMQQTAAIQLGGGKGELDHGDNRVIGDEFSQYVISQRSGIMLRAGTLLKSDKWQSESIETNFRRVPGSPIFALGQPSQHAILQVVSKTRQQLPNIRKVLWINLREEPVVMVCGDPYCLRKENMSLRNLKDYSGVSGSRLEVLEDRLVSDIKAELRTFDGKILLHTETQDGWVAPVWEDVQPDEVESLRQLFARASEQIPLDYKRLPLTAQSPLDFQDIQDLLTLCLRNDLRETAIILNDQLGRGRSTLTSVYIFLIIRWIRQAQDLAANNPRTPRLLPGSSKSSWQIINSCLRCLRRNGLEVKRTVDEAIDICGQAFNLREAIETAFRLAEETEELSAKRSILKDGKLHLARYLQLIQFQAYLEDLPMDTTEALPSFASWYGTQPVFKTFDTEIKHGGVEILIPINQSTDGPVTDDEAERVIQTRRGRILSAGTIIKSDLFLNLQKMSLPERVEGVANYRREPLLLEGSSPKSIYGTGMPTSDGLRRAGDKMCAKGGRRKLKWTSMREEPVLYIAGVPHVLRIADRPITNIETTGVDANLVERMEESFKRDVLDEIARDDGRILLHDEIETSPGHYSIVPVWENVGPEDIKTPKELYEDVQREGYDIDYRRIAVTDEQAPLPEALTVIINRVRESLDDDSVDYVFNCQMGRGRTTTGMIASSIIASISKVDDVSKLVVEKVVEGDVSEKEAYLAGEC